jgi:pyrroline-5-carboxylate reductase
MKITVIGCGVMGSAFAKQFAKEHTVYLCDVHFERATQLAKEIGGTPYRDFSEAVKHSEIVFLAVKPKDLAEVARITAAALSNKHLIISILAGTPLSFLKKHFQKGDLLRLMPNTAVTCHQGVIGLVEEQVSQEIKQKAEALLKGLGLLVWLPESKIDALSALSASGPAFIFVIIEALIEGGIAMGFTARDASEFVLQTIEGAVALMRKTGKHPAELKWEVASPGGTTIAGLREMESARIRAGLMNTLLTCYKRNLQMREEIEDDA